MTDHIRIGVLISGGGSNLQAIIDACQAGRIDGRVVFVGSDNPDAQGLARATKHGIPTFVVDYRSIIKHGLDNRLPEDFDLDRVLAVQHVMEDAGAAQKRFFCTRAVAEARLLDQMAAYPFDLLVLAGFMRVLTPYFIDRVNKGPLNPRIMNIHPALLPAFPGVDGYGDTFRYGCKVGGCTVHFVDYGEDTGPIIGQRAFAIEPGDTLESVRQKGLKLEWDLYPQCIEYFAKKRLRVTIKRYPQKGQPALKRKIVEILP
ncbi:MAG: phosphoribosylglycinamide formyltransferase [Deltaproteobacteria bacterium]|nr:phosphoribosylglycinamide formyltransferase [Deltaproteobacteria bacterium]